MRDTEFYTYNALREMLAVATGIPSGRIWAQWPAIEFINKPLGTNVPLENPQLYPCIAITPYKDTKISYNNYGDTIYVYSASGMVTAYQPLGDVCYHLMISLFTVSRKDQRLYGTAIMQTLLGTKFKMFENDEIDGEYFGIKVIGDRNGPESMPYHKPFLIECSTRILEEVTGHKVKEIITDLSTVESNGVVVYDQTIDVRLQSDLVVERFEYDPTQERVVRIV